MLAYYLVVIVGIVGSIVVTEDAVDVNAKSLEHVTRGERAEYNGKGENQSHNEFDLLHFFVPSLNVFFKKCAILIINLCI